MPREPPPVAEEERPEDTVRVNLYRRWALLASVTRSVQVVKRGKKAKELDPEDPEKWPWQDSSLRRLVGTSPAR